MKKSMMTLFAVAAIVLIGCGDNNKAIDAATHRDSSTVDGVCSDCPAVPALGPQIDRLGRPAVNTALNHGFDAACTATTCPGKDAYNQDEGVGTWPATYAPQFGLPLVGGTAGPSNLGIIDVLDTGLTCTAGACTANGAATASDGCGNQVLFNGNPGGGGTAVTTSYSMLAGILADDQLYLDTTKTACEIPSSHANYLAVEFNVVTGVANSTCGGRAPTNDVIDTTYTAVAVGIQGFATADFKAAFGDGVDPHPDVSNDTFPFLGAPH